MSNKIKQLNSIKVLTNKNIYITLDSHNLISNKTKTRKVRKTFYQYTGLKNNNTSHLFLLNYTFYQKYLVMTLRDLSKKKHQKTPT